MVTTEVCRSKLNRTSGSANTALRKKLLYTFAERLGLLTCFRCGQPVSYEEFTIDHKETWQDAEDPEKAYFDVDNVAFSHASCNYGARKDDSRRINSVSGYRGVSYNVSGRNKAKPWVAKAWMRNKSLSVGRFETAEEAARAYDTFIEKLPGRKKLTNRELGLLR